jgi:hypothetical protein
MRGTALVENETLKILRRKRFRVVLLVLGVLLAVVVFGQARQRRNAERDNPSGNWRARVESRITGGRRVSLSSVRLVPSALPISSIARRPMRSEIVRSDVVTRVSRRHCTTCPTTRPLSLTGTAIMYSSIPSTGRKGCTVGESIGARTSTGPSRMSSGATPSTGRPCRSRTATLSGSSVSVRSLLRADCARGVSGVPGCLRASITAESSAAIFA